MVSASTAIAGYFGQEVQFSLLGEEMAFPQVWGRRRVIGDAVASGLSPLGLATILQRAAWGDARAYLTLAEEMEERYLHYASQLQTRRLAIEGIPVSVEHDEKVPARIVDAVNELVEGSDFDEMLGALTDGIGKGYSAVEQMWEYERLALRPVKYIWRDPRFFQFDEATQTELRVADERDVRNGLALPPAKFIVHRPRSKMGLPLRGGMARPAAWAFLIQSFALRDWASFAEIYGVPLRVGKFHSNASDKDKASLLRAVRDIANDAAAIIPSGMEVEFAKVEGQHGTAVFGGLMDYVDKQVSKLVNGQTMTSDDGGSLAQAKVHENTRIDINRADCKQVAQTINRDLIIPFVLFNFGPQDVYPRVSLPVSEPEDLQALTSFVTSMVPFGLRVSAREMRERGGLSEPEDGEEMLVAPAPKPVDAPGAPEKKPARKPETLSAHVAGCLCAGCAGVGLAAGASDGTDEVETLAAAFVDEFEEIADPILEPLRAILAEETSFAGVLKRLENEGPDTRRLVESLARATSIARGIGDVRD